MWSGEATEAVRGARKGLAPGAGRGSIPLDREAPTKRLRTDLSDLTMAFQSQDDGMQRWFLGTDTGEVLLQTDDISPTLDEFLEEAEDPEEDREGFLARLDASDFGTRRRTNCAWPTTWNTAAAAVWCPWNRMIPMRLTRTWCVSPKRWRTGSCSSC